MDGWMFGECDHRAPQLWPPRVGGWWEGRERENVHHYQHYGARRKIPLAVMVGMYCNRVGPHLWPLGVGGGGEGRDREYVHHYQQYVTRRKISLHWL